jgi:hypothetical protein
MSNNGFLKRLEALGQRISFRRGRMIVLAVDGNNENHEAEANLLEGLAVTPQDLVVAVRRFGGTDPDLPRLGSITPI